MKNGRYQCKDIPDEAVLEAIHEAAQERRRQPKWWLGEQGPRVRERPWYRRCGLAEYPPKLVFAKADIRRLGPLIEYGTSMNFPWLTDIGERALRDAKTGTVPSE